MISEALASSQQLMNRVPLLAGSQQREDYEQALQLAEYLVQNDPDNPLLALLCDKIDLYESLSSEFAAFNARLKAIHTGVGVLRTLIDQYQLKLSDFEQEIGKKSLVSRILSGDRKLTIEHIRALSRRFGVPVELFIDK